MRVNFEADSNNEEQPMQIHIQSSESESPRLFSSLRGFSPFRVHPRSLFFDGGSLLESKPAPLPFPTFFQSLLKSAEEEPMEPPAEMFSFQFEPISFEPEQPEFPPFSRVFQRMNDIVSQFQNTIPDQVQRPVKPVRRGGDCSLLELCGEDVDKYCAYAKRLALAQAIPRCLVRNRAELSERCGSFLDRKFGADGMPLHPESESEPEPEHAEDDDDDNDDAVLMNSTPVPEEAVKESADTPVPAPATVPPRQLCQDSARTLCPDINLKNMVHVMSCLNRNRDQVPSACLDIIQGSAAFNCAPDAEKFCPAVSDRSEVVQCLKPHAKELSPACVQAAAQHPSNSHKLHGKMHVLGADSDSTSSVMGRSNVLAAVGVVGLIALVVAGVVVVVRRRRASARYSRFQPSTSVQFSNPTVQLVSTPVATTAASVSYEPRAEDQL